MCIYIYIYRERERDLHYVYIYIYIYMYILHIYIYQREVFACYEEMRSHEIPCNTITYNTMLDA